MKRTVTATALALILALVLAACGAKGGEEDVQIPTPWTEYESQDEALRRRMGSAALGRRLTARAKNSIFITLSI